MLENMKVWAVKKLSNGTGNIVVSANDYTNLRLKASQQVTKKEEVGLSKEHLTMKQLGSYLPSFKPLEQQTDDFKNSLGRLCFDLMKSEEWQYLANHLKQDQVNISLFSEEVKHSDDWVRGSINGIYVVEDQIAILGANYEDRLNKGLLSEK